MDEILLELLDLLKSNLSKEELIEKLSDYHERDIARAIPSLSEDERKRLYDIIDEKVLADIFAYLDDVGEYLEELSDEDAADIIEQMDTDDAIEVLEELEDEDRENIIKLMDKEAVEDIKIIKSYDEDEIGSKMTTNFIVVSNNFSVTEAMKKLISEAPENDNINTIFVVDKSDKYYGAITLKDLIIARKTQTVEDIVMLNYPHTFATTKIDDCIHDLQEYELDLIPVLDEDETIIGALTHGDINAVAHEEFEEDYARLAGMLSNEEDFKEKTIVSMKKRLPWLILLMGLGLVVSSLISGFEGVIAVLPVLVFFQSLILDMAGNSGTQSLAVTIRVITNETSDKHYVLKMLWKEFRVGLCNGFVLALIAFTIVIGFLFVGQNPIYSDVFVASEALKVAFIVAVSLMLTVIVATSVGTLMPIIFKKIKIDPAVASGPLITTLNDLLAIVVYYGLAALLFNIL